MSITDEMTNMVNPHLLGGLQTQHIMSPTPTCNLLSGMLRKKMGAAGNGVKITDLIEQGEGRFYRGLDTAQSRRSNEGTVGHFEEWSNLQEDIVIAGTQLEEVLGMTTSQVVKADTSLRGFRDSDRLTFINLAGMRAEQAAVSGMADIDRALWGEYLPDDNKNRMPSTLDELFNENGRFHGLGPGDLGEWEPKKQVWGDNPVNTAKDKRRHIPQIFTAVNSAGEANPGTPRLISREVLLEPAVKMSANISGYWIAPTHPDLFLRLSNDQIPDNDRVPIYTGTNWSYRVEAIRIQNTYYYVEQRAKPDRIRHLHVGMMDGTGGSFFPFAWQANEETDIRSLLTAADPTPNLPGVPLGNAQAMWPWYTQEWNRGENYADAIYCELVLKWMWLCTYRWKQYEVRDLKATA